MASFLKKCPQLHIESVKFDLHSFPNVPTVTVYRHFESKTQENIFRFYSIQVENHGAKNVEQSFRQFFVICVIRYGTKRSIVENELNTNHYQTIKHFVITLQTILSRKNVNYNYLLIRVYRHHQIIEDICKRL